MRLSDKIAYVNSDIDDAIRAMILDEEDIPVELRRTLGFTTRERLDHLIHDIISNSMGRDDIIMSDETAEALRICACSCLNMYTGIRSQKARK